MLKQLNTFFKTIQWVFLVRAKLIKHTSCAIDVSQLLMALLESLLLGQQEYYGLFPPSVLKANAKMVKVSEHPTENHIKGVT